jgi:hypothetical protein
MRVADLFENQNLDELSVPRTRDAAVMHLWKAGYDSMGTGAFGSVYAKPGSPFVIKLFDNIDRAFPAFVALAMANQANPHFPRFRGKLFKMSEKYSAVRMERLSVYHYDSTLIRRYMVHRDHLPAPEQRDPESHTQMQWMDALDFMEEYPTLKQAADLIIDNLAPQFRIDISNDNLMLRNRTIVFTDPVAPNAF